MGKRGRGAKTKEQPPKLPAGRPSLKTPPELVEQLWELVPLTLDRYKAILESDSPEAMRHQVNVGAKVLDLLLRAKNEQPAEPPKPEPLRVEVTEEWRSNDTREKH